MSSIDRSSISPGSHTLVMRVNVSSGFYFSNDVTLVPFFAEQDINEVRSWKKLAPQVVSVHSRGLFMLSA